MNLLKELGIGEDEVLVIQKKLHVFIKDADVKGMFDFVKENNDNETLLAMLVQMFPAGIAYATSMSNINKPQTKNPITIH